MKKIDSAHFFNMLLFSFLSLNFVSFPSQTAILCASDGIIPLGISCAAMYVFSVLLIRFMRRHKGQDYYSALRLSFGNVPAAVVCTVHTLTSVYLCAYATRIISEQINIYMLDGYSILLIEAIFLAACMYSAHKSFFSIAVFSKILSGQILFVLALLFVLCLSNADSLNMLPLFTSSPEQYARASLNLVSHCFSAAFCIPYIYPYLSADKKGVTEKKILYAILISAAVFAAYYVLCISILGVETCTSIIFPAINIMHNNTSSGILLNRYEIILVSAVCILYFHYVSLMLKCSVTSLSRFVPQKISAGVSVSLLWGLLLLLNNRKAGEYIGGLMHMKGLLAYIPLGIALILAADEIKLRREKNVIKN